MSKHTRTDPLCRHHRRPGRSRLSRWWHDRARGKACHACHPLYVRGQHLAPDWYR